MAGYSTRMGSSVSRPRKYRSTPMQSREDKERAERIHQEREAERAEKEEKMKRVTEEKLKEAELARQKREQVAQEYEQKQIALKAEGESFIQEHIKLCESVCKEENIIEIGVDELINSIRSSSTNEELEKYCRIVAYRMPRLTGELLDACMWALPEINDDVLQDDLSTTICILALENEDVDTAEFLESDYSELLFDWAERGLEYVQEYICGHLWDHQVLQGCALEGAQWAFDFIRDNGFGDFDDTDLIEFCSECEDAGVDIGDSLDYYVDLLGENEDVVGMFASAKAYGYLCGQLATYSWIEYHLAGNDQVAEIAEEHLTDTIKYRDDFKWLKMKADAKVPQAQYLMGLLYLTGEHKIVGKNKSLALRYLRAAKEGGCELAEAKLVDMATEDQEEAKDSEKVLLAKANKGNVNAMFELGNLYSFRGNDVEAQKWYRKAGRKGHKKAKGSRKGTSLKKRPVDGCVWMLILLIIVVGAIIALGIFWGWTNVITMFGIVFLLWWIFTEKN